jgi:hypothetical protein
MGLLVTVISFGMSVFAHNTVYHVIRESDLKRHCRDKLKAHNELLRDKTMTDPCIISG